MRFLRSRMPGIFELAKHAVGRMGMPKFLGFPFCVGWHAGRVYGLYLFFYSLGLCVTKTRPAPVNNKNMKIQMRADLGIMFFLWTFTGSGAASLR